MCKSSAAFQSLRLPPTNWKKAVTDWYDEVGSSLIPIEQMIINRCGCSAEMMSSRLCSTQPSATTASLCGRKHTRYKVVRFPNCHECHFQKQVGWGTWLGTNYKETDKDTLVLTLLMIWEAMVVLTRSWQKRPLWSWWRWSSCEDNATLQKTILYPIRMTFTFNNSDNHRWDAELHPTAKVIGVHHICHHIDIILLPIVLGEGWLYRHQKSILQTYSTCSR